MKRLCVYLLVLLPLFQTACSKDGETGPAGPAGPAGPQGPAGPAGNANVIQITFGSKTHSGSEINYSLTGVTQAQLSGSAFFTYVNPGNGYWYSLPGTTAGGSKEYRTYVQATATSTPFLMLGVCTGTPSSIMAMRPDNRSGIAAAVPR